LTLHGRKTRISLSLRRVGAKIFVSDSTLITIGLTGGIASGKSVLSQMLAGRGAVVVDVDGVAHETYRAGTPGFRALVDAFGASLIGADGEIDRRVLGGLVFGKADEMKRLTEIVWPLARARIEATKREAEPKSGVLVFEAAVLVEAGWTDIMDEVWVVSVPVAVARARLMARNGISPEQADARIASQITNDERARHARVIIDNSGDLDDLRRRVDEAWQQLTARTATASR
jgi:dephospho-CoA kinase